MFYAEIPRAIKDVHEEAISEIRGLRGEIAVLAERAAADSWAVAQKADAIRGALDNIQPAEVAKLLHQRLLDDTLAAFGGSSQALKAACAQASAATQALNESAYQAAVAIDAWQTLSLRRVPAAPSGRKPVSEQSVFDRLSPDLQALLTRAHTSRR